MLLTAQLADRDFLRNAKGTPQRRTSPLRQAPCITAEVRGFSARFGRACKRARLGGGAASHARTRLSCQFPDQQGKYRELLPKLGLETRMGAQQPTGTSRF